MVFNFDHSIKLILCHWFYPQNLSWRQQRKFHLKRDWRKSTKFFICSGLVCFEL